MKKTCANCANSYRENKEVRCDVINCLPRQKQQWRPKKQTCGNCVYYLTDEDDKGDVTDYHHDRNKERGFCALRDLILTVKKDDKICSDYVYDKED